MEEKGGWTIRSVGLALRQKVKTEAVHRGLTLGQAVEQALTIWLNAEPVENTEHRAERLAKKALEENQKLKQELAIFVEKVENFMQSQNVLHVKHRQPDDDYKDPNTEKLINVWDQHGISKAAQKKLLAALGKGKNHEQN